MFMLPEKLGLISLNGQSFGLKRTRHLIAIAFCTLALLGCNATMQSVAAGHALALPSNLPSASIGKAYRAVLSVNGGRAPYHFAVSQGTLPSGLALNVHTGNIAGIPTQAGTFELSISVSDAVLGAFGIHRYTMAIDSCDSCARVEITPATPTTASGGKIKFSATVSNVSNPAVTWWASAGTISDDGLFTAPVAKAARTQTVTVRATSVAQPLAQASTVIAVGSADLTLATSSIPAATSGSPYSTSLVATGGQAPYQWALVSGSLPAGLQLDASSGGLTGATSHAGSFTFGVRVTDAAARTAQQSLTLLVSSSDAGCGPPKYNCSRSDLLLAKVLSPIPDMGNLSGAGRVAADPSFGSRVARVTDATTNPGFLNRGYAAGEGGSADANIFNIDSTLLFVQDTGSWMIPMAFDPASMRAERLYSSSYPADGGLKIEANGAWSLRDANVLYTFDRLAPTLNKYDFSDRTTPPQSTPVFDFSSGSHCLPSGFHVTWSSVGGGSSDDTVFAVAYSNHGGQGSGVYAVAYKAGQGCTLYNTQTGQVTGDWGVQGSVTAPDRFTIHNVKLSKDGNWLVIVNTTCFAGKCEGPFFWQVGTTTVTDCAKHYCSGHWTEGHSTWINAGGSPQMGQYESRSFSAPLAPRPLISQFPVGLRVPFDQHASWNNVDPADSYPFFSTTWSSNMSAGVPWYNEILGISPLDGTVWRFAHTYITTASHRFSTKYAIGAVSQDGRFFAFSSDWMGTLGSESGSAGCTVSKDCRGDVFVVELK